MKETAKNLENKIERLEKQLAAAADLQTIAYMNGVVDGKKLAVQEAVQIVHNLIHDPECVDQWSITRTCAFIAVKEVLKQHFGLGEQK